MEDSSWTSGDEAPLTQSSTPQKPSLPPKPNFNPWEEATVDCVSNTALRVHQHSAEVPPFDPLLTPADGQFTTANSQAESLPGEDHTDGGTATVPRTSFLNRGRSPLANVERIKKFLASTFDSSDQEEQKVVDLVGPLATDHEVVAVTATEVSKTDSNSTARTPYSNPNRLIRQDAINFQIRTEITNAEHSQSTAESSEPDQESASGTKICQPANTYQRRHKRGTGGPIKVVLSEQYIEDSESLDQISSQNYNPVSSGSRGQSTEDKNNLDGIDPNSRDSSSTGNAEIEEESRKKEPLVTRSDDQLLSTDNQVLLRKEQPKSTKEHLDSQPHPQSSSEATEPSTGGLISALKNGRKKSVKRVSFADEGSERRSLVEEFQLRDEGPVSEAPKSEKPVPPPRTTIVREEKSGASAPPHPPQRLVLQKSEGGGAKLVRVTWLGSAQQASVKKKDEESNPNQVQPKERVTPEAPGSTIHPENDQQLGYSSPDCVFVFPESSVPADPPLDLAPTAAIPSTSGVGGRTPSVSDDVFLSPNEEAAFASRGQPFSGFVVSAPLDRPAEVEAVNVISTGDSLFSASDLSSPAPDSSCVSDSVHSPGTDSSFGYPSSSDSAFTEPLSSDDQEEDDENIEEESSEQIIIEEESSSEVSDEEESDDGAISSGDDERITGDPVKTDSVVGGANDTLGHIERSTSHDIGDTSIKNFESGTEGANSRDRTIQIISSQSVLQRDSGDIPANELRVHVVENSAYTENNALLITGAKNLLVKEVLLPVVANLGIGTVVQHSNNNSAGVGDGDLAGKTILILPSQEKFVTLNYVTVQAEKDPRSDVGNQALVGSEGRTLRSQGSSDLPPTPPPSPVEGEAWEGSATAGALKARPPEEEAAETKGADKASKTGSTGSKHESARILPVAEEGSEGGGTREEQEEKRTEIEGSPEQQRQEETELINQGEPTSEYLAVPSADPTSAAGSTFLVLTRDEVYEGRAEVEEGGREKAEEDDQESVRSTPQEVAPGGSVGEQQVEDGSHKSAGAEMQGPPEGQNQVPLRRALDHIEQLQQNLATRLSPGAVQAIRAEFKAAAPAAAGGSPDIARRREEFFRDGLSGTSPSGGSSTHAAWRRSAEVSPVRGSQKSPLGSSTVTGPAPAQDSWRHSAEVPATTHNVTVVTKRVLWVADTDQPPAGKGKQVTLSDAEDSSPSPKSSRVFISLSPKSVEKLTSGRQQSPTSTIKQPTPTGAQENGSAHSSGDSVDGGPGTVASSASNKVQGAHTGAGGRQLDRRPPLLAPKPFTPPRVDSVHRVQAPGIPKVAVEKPQVASRETSGSPGRITKTEPAENGRKKPEVPAKPTSRKASSPEKQQQQQQQQESSMTAAREVAMAEDADIPYADSDDEASGGETASPGSSAPSRSSEPAPRDNRRAAQSAAAAAPGAASGRMSWTQQLLEKLSEEEDAKKKRHAEAPRKPPRLVRYPGQRDADQTPRRSAVERVLQEAAPGTDAYADLIDRLIDDGGPQQRQYGPGGVPLRRQVSLEEDSGSTTSSDGAETARLRQKIEEELRTVAAIQQRRRDSSGERSEQVQRPPAAMRVSSPPPAARAPEHKTVKVTALVEKPSTAPKRLSTSQQQQQQQSSTPQRVAQAKVSASTPSPPKQLTTSPDKDAIKPKPISPVVRKSVTSPSPASPSPAHSAGGRPPQAVLKTRSPPAQQQQQQKQQQQQQQQEQQAPQPKTKSSGLRRFLSPAASLFSSASGNSARNRRSLSEDRTSRSSPLVLKPYKSKKQQPSPGSQDDAAQRQPLLAQKKPSTSAQSAPLDSKRKVYPASNAPLVETAFLSEPRQNLVNAGADYRHKPLPPVPPQRTSSRGDVASSHSSARTLPDTSLVLEERLHSIRRSLTPTHYARIDAPPGGDFAGRRQQKRYQSLPPMSSLPATRQQLEAIERAARGSPPGSVYQVVAKPEATPAPQHQQMPPTAQLTNRARQQATYPERLYQQQPQPAPDPSHQRTHAVSTGTTPETRQSPRAADASSPSSSSTTTVVSQQQHQQQHHQQPRDVVDAADMSPGSAEVQRLLQERPPMQAAAAMSGRASAPPTTSQWQHRYGRIHQPQSPVALMPVSATIKVTREPVYGNMSQATPTQPPPRQQQAPLSPMASPQSPGGQPPARLSRRELEALYWHTQRLRDQLAAQKRYLGMTGPAPASSSSVASTATAGSASGVYSYPQPVYSSPQQLPPQHRRSRSMSPSPYHAPLSPASVYPLYGSNRSLSLSLPRGVGLPELYDAQQQQHLVRGAPYRSTVAAIRTHSASERTSTPTIYEEASQQAYADYAADGSAPRRRSGHGAPTAGGPPPIFKRGSLQGLPEPEGPPSAAAKRVSFTAGDDLSPAPHNWPTRNGPAPRPPSRNRDSGDSDVFLPYADYVNLADLGYAVTSTAAERRRPYGVVVRRGGAGAASPDRPLPPLPPSAGGDTSGSNSSVYGVVVRRPPAQQQQLQLSPDRWQQQRRPSFPSPTGRWQHSESESGSEAGEVQRILGRARRPAWPAGAARRSSTAD